MPRGDKIRVIVAVGLMGIAAGLLSFRRNSGGGGGPRIPIPNSNPIPNVPGGNRGEITLPGFVRAIEQGKKKMSQGGRGGKDLHLHLLLRRFGASIFFNIRISL
ncbi:hypothetical protein F5Y08DRAFT_345476 [Xylaria arbuscula]|nr:hypothetical protein F5Y08DRAFT_345476 [Xylaria arbuscula]